MADTSCHIRLIRQSCLLFFSPDNSDLDDLVRSLPAIPSASIKLHNNPETHKMIMIIIVLDSSETPGLNCILVVVRRTVCLNFHRFS